MELKAKGFSDAAVLQAIENVPRHVFIESSAFLEHAYEDKAFPINCGQTISQPSTVAKQTTLLEIKKGEKVLEIGTGSGYQTCVLLELGAKVFTIERQRGLYVKTSELLPKMGYKPKFYYGDGYAGLHQFAPYNKIIVTAGAPFIPENLKSQLMVGGRMVIPVGENTQSQKMLLLERLNESEFKTTDFGFCQFVPLLEDKEWSV